MNAPPKTVMDNVSYQKSKQRRKYLGATDGLQSFEKIELTAMFD